VSHYIKTRSFLSQNVDPILDGLVAVRTMKKNDTDDLFAANTSDSSEVSVNWKAEYTALSKYDILASEKESLGIYVSGSPLEDYRDVVEWCRNITARDDIHLVIVDKVKKIFTKAGVMMFALQLTCLDEDVEGVIFPKKAVGLSSVLAEKSMFWIRGAIQQTKKKPTKPEPVDLDSELESEKEIGEPLKEYEELPKLIVENITPFEGGLLKVFEGDEKNSLAMNRKDKISNIDWNYLKENPHGLDDVLDGQTQRSTTSSESKSTTARIVYLPVTLGVTALQDAKNNLQSSEFQGSIEVSVMVESKTGFKKTKSNFWVTPEFYQQYKQ
jgi:hypothetical protein